MEVVARYLTLEARRQSEVDRDLFGRSAFNRYYYATYLLTRDLLRPAIPSWPGSHSNIPGWLRGAVLKGLTKGSQQAQRVQDGEVVRLCESARVAARELAKLLEQSYGVRVTADYDPDVAVRFDVQGEFELNTVRVAEAQAWPHRARGHAHIIAGAWKQINV